MDIRYSLLLVLIPLFGSIPIAVVPWKNLKIMRAYCELLVVLVSVLTWGLILSDTDGASLLLFRFQKGMELRFALDDMSKVFAGLVASLWPLASLYTFEYMSHDKKQCKFLCYYTITYGVTLGIALSENIVTMYCFYECLTLITLPLVLHYMDKAAIHASRTYLYYSLGGAAFAFIGIAFLIFYGETASFVPGGVFSDQVWSEHSLILSVVYLISFCGFSVKAAMWPFGAWLPKASVAPTPVTALLHAVAVVKSGAFAVIRLTFYCYGINRLRGSAVQKILIILTLITILYGSASALKETHIKRRLAYSTMSNLSYILFGVALMTPIGLVGALCHLIFHAIMKITAFFCAGAVMHQTDCHYIYDLDGFGRRMPITFTAYTIAGFGLMGVPLLPGFISKWNLCEAAILTNDIYGLAGVLVLLTSALFTAIYMMTVSVRVFFPQADFDYSVIAHVKDPNWKMLVPIFILIIAMFGFGIFSEPIVTYFTELVKVF